MISNPNLLSLDSEVEGFVAREAVGMRPPAVCLRDLIIPRPNFVPWKLNKNYELEIWNGAYCIPLGEIHNSASMLDWVFQINKKVWATPQIVKQLLNALNYYLSPQQFYCSWEQNLEVENPKLIINRRLENETI